MTCRPQTDHTPAGSCSAARPLDVSGRLGSHLCNCDTPNVLGPRRGAAWLIVWEETSHWHLSQVPRRPVRFVVSQDNRHWGQCAGPSWSTYFQAGGRELMIDVHLGPGAGSAVRDRVDSILDSLTVRR